MKIWSAGEKVLASDLNNNFASVNLLNLFAGEALSFGDVVKIANYQVGGAITLDTKGANSSTSIGITIGNNNDRILVVFVLNDLNSSTPSVSFGGTAMTHIAGYSYSYASINAFYMISPPTGANTLTISGGGGTSYTLVNYFSYYNVDQTSPIDSYNGNASSSGIGSYTVGVNNAAGLLVSSQQTSSSGPYYSSANQSYNRVDINNANHHLCGGDSGPVANPATLTLNPASTYSSIGVSLKPANAPVPAIIKSAAGDSDYNATVGLVADSTIAAESNGNILNTGIISGLSGLALGATYYLSNTSGLISTIPGTNSKKIGVAVSDTELLILIS